MLNQIEQNGEYGMADEAVAPKRVQPRLASAIMLLRDRDAGQGIEVFMVRRGLPRDFLPGVYGFSGGSVLSDDKAAGQRQKVCVPLAAGGGGAPEVVWPAVGLWGGA